MIELSPESEGNIFVIRASGTVTRAEEEAFLQEILDRLEDTRGSIRIVTDDAGVEHREKGVVSTRLWFEMRYRPRVERFAIIGDDSWEDERTRSADIFKSAEVRRFDPADRTAALAWVRGA